MLGITADILLELVASFSNAPNVIFSVENLHKMLSKECQGGSCVPVTHPSINVSNRPKQFTEAVQP